eukprot:TRINITY_DN6298_c0_g1_i1.p1 TRINITY_DN6298_c0_g1~~TRINITY_DN6298_c0_g1_i1.p1  ORF type:complete len:104 (+),score=2.73 TRINITY_DN6298_c0_g1_i1:291-602(+)
MLFLSIYYLALFVEANNFWLCLEKVVELGKEFNVSSSVVAGGSTSARSFSFERCRPPLRRSPDYVSAEQWRGLRRSGRLDTLRLHSNQLGCRSRPLKVVAVGV